VAASTLALHLSVWISLAIVALLAIVAISYSQTIRAYPQGGGSYIVTKSNLGTIPSLIAASSLLTDYVLTVAVSISAGVAALTSAVPELLNDRVFIAVLFIVLITVINLRGVRESGTILAAPTYLFILGILIVLAVGGFRLLTGMPPAADVRGAFIPGAETISVFLILRAFASGCAALTGTEAISDGVPAFKPPEWLNARRTLLWMAIVLGILFFGISLLAFGFGVIPQPDETVISQVARASIGTSPLYYFVQGATMLILVLAANTSFSDFPRLSYFLARDNFMPHQFQFRGDRLGFSTGIVALAALAIALVIFFGADTHALIPLYAIGVFVSFTFSQASMVRRWWVLREAGWRRSFVINGVGAVTTGVVATVVAVS
ncbi:MAG: APC family permease, partial [Dehalococcoidia bacterium]|nr:APC family permease [Dehalococcoidia bacterium]